MAVYDRWWKAALQPDGTRKRVHSADYGCERRWQVRWRDEQGKQRTQVFARKAEAEALDVKIRAQLKDGTYTDPSAGLARFRDYAEGWRKRQTTHDLATAERIEASLRNHVYAADGTPGRTPSGAPALGDYPMRALSRQVSLVQTWIAGAPLHPNSVRLLVDMVSPVFAAAVEDGLIPRNPFRSSQVKKPPEVKHEATAWTAVQVEAVAAELPACWSAFPYLGASTAMRQGELFAFALDDLDWLRKVARVAVQVKYVGGALVFAPIKNKKNRDVPVADPVIPVLSEHVRLHPPVAVTLPWHDPRDRKRHGKPVTRRLIFTRPDGGALTRPVFNRQWRKAWRAAGIAEAEQVNGCHVLRHTAASEWLSKGLGLARVAAYLGDTKEVVLKTYAHFMPDDEDRAREIMNAFFAPPEVPGDRSCATSVQPGPS